MLAKAGEALAEICQAAAGGGGGIRGDGGWGVGAGDGLVVRDEGHGGRELKVGMKRRVSRKEAKEGRKGRG